MNTALLSIAFTLELCMAMQELPPSNISIQIYEEDIKATVTHYNHTWTLIVNEGDQTDIYGSTSYHRMLANFCNSKLVEVPADNEN